MTALEKVSAIKRNANTTLAGVAQWIECQPVNQKVMGSIPSRGARDS